MEKIDALSMGKIVVIREKLLKKVASGERVFRFESGDPSFDIPNAVKEGVLEALSANKTHYIPNNGIPELRQALALKLQKHNQITNAEAKDVAVTNGAMHALYITYQCLVSDDPHQKNEVIVPDPMWTEAVENARLAGAKIIPVELKSSDSYVYLASNIEKKITSNTLAIFLNSPQNPTGAIIPRDELEKILALAKRHNLWLVSDEAYEHVVFDGGRHCSIQALDLNFDRCISIFSFSKSYAMSGMRLGYVYAKNSIFQERISKILRCTVNGINSVTQWGAVKGLSSVNEAWFEDMNQEFLKRRNLFLEVFKQQTLLVPYTPKGAFFLWCQLHPDIVSRLGVDKAYQKVNELSDYLIDRGIGNAPGDSFGDCVTTRLSLRFSFSCHTSMIVDGGKELLEALKDFNQHLNS